MLRISWITAANKATNVTRLSKHDINHSREMSRLERSPVFAKNVYVHKKREKNVQRETKSSTQHKNVLNSEKSFQTRKQNRLSGLDV